MRGEEAAVDCWNDGEEGDFLVGRFGRVVDVDAVGTVGAVGGEEGRGESFPYGVGVKGEHEFDGGAGE